MNSDAENIPPSLGLLPIRKLSSLIPLRKAARYQLDDPREGSSRQAAFPALKTSTNTFQSHIPVKATEKRVLPAGRDKSSKTNSKMATPNIKPTYAKLPASLNIPTTPRLPMSPPPEEELREQEKSMRKQSVSKADRDRSFPSPTSSAGRKRARSTTRNASPNPKARKQPKLQKHDTYGSPDVIGGDWEQYTIPLKSSHDTSGRKSRGSEPSMRPGGSSEGTKKGSRRRSSPAPSRSQSRSRPSVSRSRAQTPARGRPTTPVIIRTVPPPDINSLPPPAPPSPSDDPLWMPPPPPRVRPAGDLSVAYSRGRPSVADNSISYSRRRSSYNAQASYRAVSPTPAPRARTRVSAVTSASPPPRSHVALSPPQFESNADEDVSMMDSAPAGPAWNDDDEAGDLGNDFIVPLNFNTSTSDPPMPNFFPRSPQKSPRKATPTRRPGSPWLRSPSAASRENVESGFGGFGGFAPLQDAPSDGSDSDNEVDTPQVEDIVVPAQEEYYQEEEHAFEVRQERPEPANERYLSPTHGHGHSATPAHLSRPQSAGPTLVSQRTASPADSPASTIGFSGGRLLSQRFAELGNKLAAERRSFRFSEIGALPSSDGAGGEEAYDRSQRLRFPDLPSSSPEKAAEEEGQDSAELSHVEESLSSTVAEEATTSRREDPAESGLNEYSSQEDTEEVSPTEQPDYSVEQYQEEHEHSVGQYQEKENEYSVEQDQEQPELSTKQYHQQLDYSTEPQQDSFQQPAGPEHSFQAAFQAERSSYDSAEIVAAAITNASWQSGETASFLAQQEREQEYSQQNPSKETTSPVRSPTISVRGDEEDVSFISPIQAKESPLMEVVSVSSEDSDEDEDDMEEDEPVAETTYEQDAPSQEVLNSVAGETPLTSQGWRRLPVDVGLVPEAKEDETVECDEEVEEEMTHGPSWEDETDAEPLVQIRSNDPMAAARAAAILNLHHEYIQGTPKRQESSIWGSSSRRRSTSVMRTPAEPRSSQIFATPSRRNGDTSQLAPSPMIHAGTVRQREPSAPPSESEWRRVETVTRPGVEWAKREWRCLEQCFTDVRLELAQSLDVEDVDPEEVDLDDVVVRFVETYGAGVKLEDEWKWEKMRRRAYALIPRQREGGARGLASAITSPTQSVFTPARPSAPVIRTLQSIHDPLGSASTLHAPRYAHLVQERAGTNSPTPAPQARPGRSSRDMPPPPHIPLRSTGNSKSQGLYPKLPPQPSRQYQIPPSTPLGPTIKAVPEPTSASRKMWNWMGSFLKVGSEPPVSENGEAREFIPSLPPISDADREALRHVPPQPPKQPERIVPPKDQVQLQHVPTPVPIRIPRKLNHKGSSGSVKDLVKSFESISETENRVASRPFVIKKTSASSLRSMDSSDEWSREQSQSQDRSQSTTQDSSVGSIRSVRSMVQNYSGSPATSQQSHAAGRVHVGSFRMGDGARW